ncbi:MAG TPA: ClcB-like voltage-gated chloride channel protein [Opitutaceae bacterium]|nr:ClcB-like voltage-gated chloride channel protein [Opitutaceae bacterium]
MKEPLRELSGDALHEVRRLRRLLLGLRLWTWLRPSDRQTLLWWAFAAGLLGSLGTVAFRLAGHALQSIFLGGGHDIVVAFAALAWWQRLLIPTVGGVLAGVVLLFARRLRGRKTDYMEAVVVGDGHVPVQQSVVRSVSALFSISSGEAIGREGPLVQLAAVAASLLGRFRRMAPARLRLLVACGAAAGIAAAYNTPLGGALFVAEIVLGSIAMETLGPLLISSVVAVLVNGAVFNDGPLYKIGEVASPTFGAMGFYILLGLLCGAGAHLWMRLLRWSHALFDAARLPLVVRLPLGGAIVGTLALWRPEAVGNGMSVIQNMLVAGHYTVPLLLTVAVVKILATASAFGSGAVGGVFTPTLFVGAVVGALVVAASALVPALPALDPTGFVLAAMGGFLAAAANAPITAILMIFEMSLNHHIMLPLMVTTVVALFTARRMGGESIYRESLQSGGPSLFDAELGELKVAQFMRRDYLQIRPAARFSELAAMLLKSRRAHVVVTGESGELRGVIQLADVEPYLRDPYIAEAVLAIDVAHETAPVLDGAMSLPQALEIFAKHEFDTLPVAEVADGRRKLVGVLDREDLYLAVSEITRRSRARAV